ncbi:response regulator [Myceligenerans xiligouense]|uniref:LuxR family two component transcriptional regulator n=1 Tax=Myceligenerans xiligouense TaxID=253184 RepID=A0A3N4ZM08_9MICO|nr:response regulator transcription factor [Myceligenerans xiligouense]RPF20961.1 LuxR family two component transcriptional regulator [Myceligenerans xiligouense]
MTGDATTTRVLIADDQALQRLGTAMFLGGQDGIDVVGEAVDGHEAVRQTEQLRPDVVLMDIRMPRMDGIAATRRIIEPKRDPGSGPWVLLLTTFDIDEYVLAGLEAGASGFLTKDAEPADLLSAIRAVAAGDAVIAPSATRRLLGRLAARTADTPATATDERMRAEAVVRRLTEREREILLAIGSGMTNTEIGRELLLAESTVKNYVGRIFTKIGARDRVHAVITAFRAGLVSAD